MDKKQLNRFYQYAFSLTAEKSWAEDVVQFSLEKVLKKNLLGQVEAGYIRSVIRNQFIDDCRRKKIISFESVEDNMPVMLDQQQLESMVANTELIENIFSSLSAAEREVLYLWAVESYTANEIANELDQPSGTVLSRLHRIRQKLIRQNQDWFSSEGGNANGF